MRTDKEKLELKGSVKNVLVETAQFEEQDGQTTEKPSFRYAFTFNAEGQIIEQATRNPDGSELRTVNHYSDSGNLLATTGYDQTGAVHSEVRYIYDANDRLTAEQHVNPDGETTTSSTYAYDDARGKMKIQELDSPEKSSLMIIAGTNTCVTAAEVQRVESRYDDRDELIEVKVFNIDGALVSRVEISRDARGNPLEEVQYIGDVSPGPCSSDSCSTEEFAALSEEQKAEFAAEVARVFAPGAVMSKHTHTYDTEGRLIESNLTMMGMEVNRRTFVYDEVGNKSEEVSYNENGTLVGKSLFTREYDKSGNWTTEILSNASGWDAEFGLSTPVQITRRVITYW